VEQRRTKREAQSDWWGWNGKWGINEMLNLSLENRKTLFTPFYIAYRSHQGVAP